MSTRMLTGDCRDILRTLPDESVHCCVTSPPYYGLRDYGTASWVGGDTDCDHQPEQEWIERGFAEASRLNGKNTQETAAIKRWYHSDGSCRRCGARRKDSQIGLEATPDAYVAELVAVFREVRRVLRSDGTLWLNLGDSYVGGGGFSPNAPSAATSKSGKYGGAGALKSGGITSQVAGLAAKQRLMIPARVALALQADGWWLRDEIIWQKPNPMPVSVTDRTTPAHEMLYMLSKSARYRYDMDAIKEPATGGEKYRGSANYSKGSGRNDSGSYNPEVCEKRQPRSVWTINASPFKGAHFATFPPDLIRPCILAGCPEGGTVLDPFGGAGTTGVVADRLQRDSIVIELSPQYAGMTENRIKDDAGMFAQFMSAHA